jgi:hypothetical protein
MVREHGPEHPSQWSAVTSTASKFGCTPGTSGIGYSRLVPDHRA